MADAVMESTEVQEVKVGESQPDELPAESNSAENGTTATADAEEGVAEPPRKRGRPASGTTPRRTPKRKSKEEKPPAQPTRRSARRSVSSRSSEATTPTEKIGEPIEAAATAVKEKKIPDPEAPIETEGNSEQVTDEKSAEPSADEKNHESDAIQPVEAEA